MPKGRLISFLEFYFVLSLEKLLLFFPFSCLYRFGYVFARVAYYLSPSSRKAVNKGLAMVFADRASKDYLKKTAKSIFLNAVWSFLELLLMPYLSEKDFQRKFSFTKGSTKILKDNISKGKGLILVTAHYGNWELMVKAIASLGFSVTALYRPFDNIYLDKYIYKIRCSYPIKLIPKNTAYYKGIKALKSNEILVFLVDQNQAKNGMFISFLGKEASTTKGPALLSYRLQAPIVLSLIERKSSYSHLISIEQLDLCYDSCYKDFIYNTTRDFTLLLEIAIIRKPDEWWWFHDRWKTKKQS